MDRKKKISKGLKSMDEAVDKAQMQRKWDEKLDVAKDVVSQSMPNEDPESVDNIAAKLATESNGAVSSGKDTIFNLTNVIDKFHHNWEMVYSPKIRWVI